jgi:hypothetical protein
MKKILTMSMLLTLTVAMTACFSKKEETPPTEIDVDEVVELVIEEAGDDLDDQEKQLIKDMINNTEVKEKIEEETEEVAEEMESTMEVMLFFRGCLEDADTKKSAVKCYEKADDLAEELGIDEEDDNDFDTEEEF